MKSEQFASVWDAIEDTPEEAMDMKIRSVMMRALRNHVKDTGMTYEQATRLFGVTQPHVDDLMCGNINQFNFEALLNMAACAGFQIEMQVTGVA
jgi:predicted XRE-type DNA-binding protein